MPSNRKKYAIVGTGSRAGMFINAIVRQYPEQAQLVALCDLSQTRMDWYSAQLPTAVPAYHADDFPRMLADRQPDTVIVTTIDAWHHHYIIAALEAGCDVISEKPLTTTLDRLQAIFAALRRSGKSLRVTFNYRYAPAYARFRELLQAGVIGCPLLVDFSWLLDTSHGADYFRRWHREKANSGGLLVHKATHHFDLVNWWIDARPQQVFALGDLLFYGADNAAARGERYDYARYTGQPAASDDPFALDLNTKAAFRGLYLAAEAETGYIRDQNVFGAPITAEDTMTVTARYSNGALLSYCLVAYAPWEGLRVAVTGTRGRLEMDIVENVTHLRAEGAAASASKGAFKRSEIRVFPMFDEPYAVEIPRAEGGHGGADPRMLAEIFTPTSRLDPLQRAASHIDGAASVLVGVAANRSIESGRMVDIRELFDL
ncbi:MAG: Gfo/Idh/MocA family oxidoreductase [Chloroflexi bacterium]|nr:Gfo/Idh/MocA family oxidoreductase [Chloroflexota bacterium]MYC55253.1 Gfo/Idh/MocA family oxidoreductase [Chloroflexota bacterium]